MHRRKLHSDKRTCVVVDNEKLTLFLSPSRGGCVASSLADDADDSDGVCRKVIIWSLRQDFEANDHRKRRISLSQSRQEIQSFLSRRRVPRVVEVENR